MPAVRGLLTGVTDCGRADLLKAESPATAVLSRGFPCRRARQSATTSGEPQVRRNDRAMRANCVPSVIGQA